MVAAALAVGVLVTTVATAPAKASGGSTQSPVASPTASAIAPRASLGSVTVTVINPSHQTEQLGHHFVCRFSASVSGDDRQDWVKHRCLELV